MFSSGRFLTFARMQSRVLLSKCPVKTADLLPVNHDARVTPQDTFFSCRPLRLILSPRPAPFAFPDKPSIRSCVVQSSLNRSVAQSTESTLDLSAKVLAAQSSHPRPRTAAWRDSGAAITLGLAYGGFGVVQVQVQVHFAQSRTFQSYYFLVWCRKC